VLGNFEHIVIAKSRPEGQRKKFRAGFFGNRHSLLQRRFPKGRMAVLWYGVMNTCLYSIIR
jgi:hypothetical protein